MKTPRRDAQKVNSVQPKDASSLTQEIQAKVLDALPFANKDDFENAHRGFVGTIAEKTIRGEEGQIVWDLDSYTFLSSEIAPPTVNPSLWRQAQLNLMHGLFQVTERIYQVRGLDISNMTIIQGDTGLILIDPLTTAEAAKAGLQLYYEHFPKQPIHAVIYTHSHVDHFGGVKGVVSEEDVRAGKVQIIAPEGFLAHAVSESVFAGNAATRRSLYMYGPLLPKSAHGQVDAGLGKTNSLGTVTLIPPTDTIHTTGEQRTIDGVEILFQMALETEAPSEMLLYFPHMRALCAAEDMTHTFHNLYTLRGAQIRNAVAWWKTINEAIELFAKKTDVVFAQHHWPTWGQPHILAFLEKQRDLYKYIHDQTLRLMNHGYTMNEVGNMIELPPELSQEWFNRGYYGSVSHNARGVYQRYLGFYSSNPAELDPLPPEEAAKNYVAFMGGADAVIKKAQEAWKRGEYRWVVQVVNHVIFAHPEHQQARHLQADALEQLGYQTENAVWRNEYLMGAFELRNAVPQQSGIQTDSPDVIKAMTLDMYFDYMGVRLNGPKAQGKKVLFNWIFPDLNQRYAVRLENSVLTYTADTQFDDPDTTITLTRALLDAISIGATTFEHELSFSTIQLDGDQHALPELLALLDTFVPTFPIVTP